MTTTEGTNQQKLYHYGLSDSSEGGVPFAGNDGFSTWVISGSLDMGITDCGTPSTIVCFTSLATCSVFSVTSAGLPSSNLAAFARRRSVAVSPLAFSRAA